MVISVAAGPYAAVAGAKKAVEVRSTIRIDAFAIPETVLVNLEAELESVPTTYQ